MSQPSSVVVAAVEAMRIDLIDAINKGCDGLVAVLAPADQGIALSCKMPTLQDGLDPRNKNGLNLTPRGVEILYRVFDDGGGYNRAAKMLSISQGAAKNRKACWLKVGGFDRVKERLDIDQNF